MAKDKKKNESFDDSASTEQVQSELPSSRFQASKSVVSTDSMGVTSSSIPGTDKLVTTSNTAADKAKRVKSKMQIAPSVSVDELENKQVGGVPLAGAQMIRNVAGLRNASVADDRSKIPYTDGGYRPATRYGKKRSEDLFELDNTISEQVVPVVEDALDLKEAPDALQGYNGRKQFKQTRSKKNHHYTNGNGVNVGKLPQQLLNETSADFITTSKVVYTSGQMIQSNMTNEENYPTVARFDGTVSDIADRMVKGNYALKGFRFTVTNGHITAVNFIEDSYTVNADPLTRDQANMNHQIDAHNVAKSVIKLQNELGRETSDKWSPLGYVIDEPYQYNMLMHDIEASTGAIMATAYRAATSSLAYQRNIVAKDGVNPQKNGVKMMVEGMGHVFADSRNDTINAGPFSDIIFNDAAYRQGSVAALIEMFDSVSKYRTKADLLGMQRSLTLHLSQASNNIAPLHCKEQFIKALDKAHMFSTVDGGYNPMLPIFQTRFIKLINPISLNYFLQDWKNPALLTDEEKADPRRNNQTGTYCPYGYGYSDLRNSYDNLVQHPLVEGLVRWMLLHEGQIVSTFGSGTTNMSAGFDLLAPSLFEFMLCSAAQEIAYARNVIYKDVLFAGDQSNYIWDDLKDLKTLNPLYSTQLTINKYDEPLKMGKLAKDTAIRELWAGQFTCTDVDSSSVQYFLPWYFNERAFGNTAGGSYTTNEGWFCEETAFNVTTPSIRDGVRHAYVDMIKDISERDLRLAMDRYITIPDFVLSNESVDGCTTYYSNEGITNEQRNSYIKLSTLRYDPNSDGRVVAKYDLASGSPNRTMDHHSIYCIPKEIGFIDDYYFPYHVATGLSLTYGSNNKVTGFVVQGVDLSPVGTVGATNTSYYYNGSSPIFITSYRVESNSSDNGAIDRSSALSQVFYNFFANPNANDINDEFVAATGLYPSFSYAEGQPLQVPGVYNLGSNNQSTSALDINVRSTAHRMWTVLQRLFFPVNRFENASTLTNNVDYDPLESSFYFGVCGTLASDYTQDVNQRLDAYDQLGLDYTEDYFVRDSLIFR